MAKLSTEELLDAFGGLRTVAEPMGGTKSCPETKRILAI